MSKVVPITPEKAPSGLSPEARALWTAVNDTFDFTGDDAGLMVLRGLCETLDRLRQIQREIGKSGFMVDGYHGQPRANPLLKVEAETRRLLLAHYRALRLPTPEELRK